MGLIKSSVIKSGKQAKVIPAQELQWGDVPVASGGGSVFQPSDQDIDKNIAYLQDLERKTADKMKQDREAFRKELEREKQGMLKEVQAIREQAVKDGRSEGIEAGKRDYAEKMRELGRAVADTVAFKQAVLLQAKHDVLALSTEIAEHLIRSELTLRPDVCMNIVIEAINKLSDRDRVVVRVGKQDVEYLRQNRDRLMSMVDGIRQLTIEEDGNIPSGGCVIETNLGYVDSRINLKLEAIHNAFEGKFKGDEKEALTRYVDTDAVQAPAPGGARRPEPEVPVPLAPPAVVKTPVQPAPAKAVVPAKASAKADELDDDDIEDLFDDADLDDLWDDDDLFADDDDK